MAHLRHRVGTADYRLLHGLSGGRTAIVAGAIGVQGKGILPIPRASIGVEVEGMYVLLAIVAILVAALCVSQAPGVHHL